jgi:hypothetical protein
MCNQEGENYRKITEKEGRKGEGQAEHKSKGLDNFGDSSGYL